MFVPRRSWGKQHKFSNSTTPKTKKQCLREEISQGWQAVLFVLVRARRVGPFFERSRARTDYFNNNHEDDVSVSVGGGQGGTGGGGRLAMKNTTYIRDRCLRCDMLLLLFSSGSLSHQQSLLNQHLYSALRLKHGYCAYKAIFDDSRKACNCRAEERTWL